LVPFWVFELPYCLGRTLDCRPGWASFDPHAWVGLLDSASPLNRNCLGARSGRGVPYRTISNLLGELSEIY